MQIMIEKTGHNQYTVIYSSITDEQSTKVRFITQNEVLY